MKRLIIVAVLVLFSGISYGKNRKPVSAHSPIDKNLWNVAATSVVKVKGNPDGSAAQCDKFEVFFGKNISFNIKCGTQEEAKKYDMAEAANFTITRKQGYATITKYGYMQRNPQVSQLEQTRLKVPFVQEIVHIRLNKNGEMAFYFEKFKVDEFGRVVQSQLIQAYGLESKKFEISSN